jgi:hypothetical protein
MSSHANKWALPGEIDFLGQNYFSNALPVFLFVFAEAGAIEDEALIKGAVVHQLAQVQANVFVR